MSFQSALGRRYFELQPGETEPRPKERPWNLARVNCERTDVDALVQRLNARYEAALRSQKPVTNPDNGIEFVKDSEHYSMLNNCNHLTARSLEQLGCRVQGLVVSSKFSVAPQPGPYVARLRRPANRSMRSRRAIRRSRGGIRLA